MGGSICDLKRIADLEHEEVVLLSICTRVLDCYDNHASSNIVDKLAAVLSNEDPTMMKASRKFWSDWFSDKIVGEKITIATEHKSHNMFVGVVRFWKTPYCNNKWLIEGLEVVPVFRRKGIGSSMLVCGLENARNLGIEKVSANIARNNIPSINIFEKLGFVKISSGSINSLGEYREYVDEYALTLELRYS